MQSMEPGGGHVQIFQEDGYQPHWSADGREVYASNNEALCGAARPGPALTPGRPRRPSTKSCRWRSNRDRFTTSIPRAVASW